VLRPVTELIHFQRMIPRNLISLLQIVVRRPPRRIFDLGQSG